MNDLSLGKLVTLIGAGVVFVFSFLPWVSVSGYTNWNAWGSGFFPMATWAPVLAFVIGFLVAADLFGFISLPEKYWEFTLDHVVLIGSIFAFIVTISYLIMDKSGGSIGAGLILCFLGTLAMVGGFVMDKLGIGLDPNATNGNAPFEQSGSPPQPQGDFPPSGQRSDAPASGQFPPAGPPTHAHEPPPQAAPAQQPPAQQPPAQQPPQGDPGSF